jgi:SAM-dependent methyltransferase
MILEFSDLLDAQHIRAHGEELASIMGRDRDAAGRRVYAWPDSDEVHVATIQGPVLMTDHHRISQFPPTVRDTILKLFESPRRTVSFQGTRFPFEQRRYPGVWGPNIDTLWLCRSLKGRSLRGVKTALEIGCGSGFIGRFILEHAPGVEQMHLVDINPHAVQSARDNVVDPRAVVELADGVAYAEGRKFDLVVCNPPYIPRPGSIGDNAYEGVDLLAHFITQGKRHLNPGGRIVTMTSSVASSIVDPLLARPGVEWSTLASHDVPFKVLNVLNNPGWMAHLRDGNGLRARLHDGYEWWHTIGVLSLHGGGG